LYFPSSKLGKEGINSDAIAMPASNMKGSAVLREIFIVEFLVDEEMFACIKMRFKCIKIL